MPDTGKQLGFAFVLTLLVWSAVASASYTLFESDPVRPVALSPDGQRLYVVNTPDNRLEIFRFASGGPLHVASVPVGIEPVAVAPRNDDEVWVVNHLSDSVSIVDVTAVPPRVVRTLLVGDEPRDLVFAGLDRGRAFVTTAHRGQNSPYMDPANPGESTTPGIGRADVWVFDADSPGGSLGGDPLVILTLFTDKPRALAVTSDGSAVYAAGFMTGNATTTIFNRAVCDGGAAAQPCPPAPGEIDAPGGLPAPNQSDAGVAQPETGLIVRASGNQWLDELGRDWSDLVRFNLPDTDVFRIDALADPPQMTSAYAGIGTVLFNMAVNPASGKLYITNTEARNEVRFEGVRASGDDTSSVIGDLHRTRITIVDTDGTVVPRHLNKHIDYTIVPAPAGVAEKSLSLPLGLAVTPDGDTLYMVAMGSDKVAAFTTAALENDTFVPDAADYIIVSGGGPSGLALDAARNRLYVTTRFDNGLSVIDTAAGAEIQHLVLPSPEPPVVTAGRRFLYDATISSSNGEASCASCHVFGDLDGLAWDLGDPTGAVVVNLNEGIDVAPRNGLHPMKGPMSTQSLRGMAGHGPLHWRGDRSGAMVAGSTFDNVREAFFLFNPAFVGLLGHFTALSGPDIMAFADFALQIQYPPNPNRALDSGLTALQFAGREFFFGAIASDFGGQLFSCNSCHVLNQAAGFFGTDGKTSFIGAAQDFKVPHLRNLYQKVGMFGMPQIANLTLTDNTHMGDQVRGFGFFHDGSIDTLQRFHSDIIFTPQAHSQAAALEQFMLAFDSNMAPIVGQQVTLDSTLLPVVVPRIELLLARAAVGDCDLVIQGVVESEQRGAVRIDTGPDTGKFQTDKASDPIYTELELRASVGAPGNVLTYTCVPRGSGVRIGIDRDEDGVWNGDDNCPAAPNPGQIDWDDDGRGDACDTPNLSDLPGDPDHAKDKVRPRPVVLPELIQRSPLP